MSELEILKDVSKKQNWLLLITAVCFGSFFLMPLFFRPNVKLDSRELNTALERQYNAIISRRASIDSFVKQTNINLKYYNKRDSAMKAEIHKVSKSISKIRNNETINAINNYTSVELRSAFAELARQYDENTE